MIQGSVNKLSGAARPIKTKKDYSGAASVVKKISGQRRTARPSRKSDCRRCSRKWTNSTPATTMRRMERPPTVIPAHCAVGRTDRSTRTEAGAAVSIQTARPMSKISITAFGCCVQTTYVRIGPQSLAMSRLLLTDEMDLEIHHPHLRSAQDPTAG